MASLQTLQHKLASLQEQYDLTASKLKAIGKQRAIETDVSERFKLDEDMKQAETDLDQLGQEIDGLDQKIRAIESGQVKLDEVLKQEGLQLAGKPAQPGKLIALVAVGVIGLGAVGVWASSQPKLATTPTPTPEVAVSQPQTNLNSRFAGTWTTEYQVQASHNMHLELQNPQNDKVEGTLKTSQRRGAGESSGFLTVMGKGQGEVVDVILYDQRGNAIGNAELRLEGENLVWRLAAGGNQLFPIKVTLGRSTESKNPPSEPSSATELPPSPNPLPDNSSNNRSSSELENSKFYIPVFYNRAEMRSIAASIAQALENEKYKSSFEPTDYSGTQIPQDLRTPGSVVIVFTDQGKKKVESVEEFLNKSLRNPLKRDRASPRALGKGDIQICLF